MDDKGGFCPLRRGKCLQACMWRMDDMCAMTQLAGQSRRQGNELYALTELLMHGPDALRQDEAAEANTP